MTTETEFDFGGMNFNAGAGAKRAEEIAASRRGAAFDRVEFLRIEDAETVGVRLLTDLETPPDGREDFSHGVYWKWITVLGHSMVPTKPAPADLDDERKKRWPKTMSAVCRKDDIFTARYAGACPIDDDMRTADGKRYTSSPKTWALGALREEVMWTREDAAQELCTAAQVGTFRGARTKQREVAILGDDGKPTDQTRMVPHVVVLNQAWKNFFGILAGMAGRWGTVLDRDLWITRSGKDTGTTYKISPGEPLDIDWSVLDADGNLTGEVVVRRFDLREPDLMRHYFPELPDLRILVADQASDRHYERFFVGAQDTSSARGADSGPASRPASPSTEVDPARKAAMRDRIMQNPAVAVQKPATTAPAASTGPRAL